jgi:hypothetical protein
MFTILSSAYQPIFIRNKDCRHYQNSYIYRQHFPSVFVLSFRSQLIYRRDHRHKCSVDKSLVDNFLPVGKSIISNKKKILLSMDLLTGKACYKKLSASFHRYFPREACHITDKNTV